MAKLWEKRVWEKKLLPKSIANAFIIDALPDLLVNPYSDGRFWTNAAFFMRYDKVFSLSGDMNQIFTAKLKIPL